MRIEQDVKLDFSDVLLKPKRSTIKSRKEIDLNRSFKFCHSSIEWSGVPIISSNMRSVTTEEVAIEMNKRGMLACFPKTLEMEIEAINFIPSFGLIDGRPNTFFDPTFLCLDVPNGYIEDVVTMVKQLRQEYEGVIIAGNVVTAEQTEALILAGADIVKVGIGSGAACSTRIKTGVGMPQLSAVMECSDAAHGLGGHIISDGGCTVPADIVKAFCAGADFVMLGGMLAGHNENAEDCSCVGVRELNNTCLECHGTGKIGAFYGSSSERGNNESAGGLRSYRASEGWEIRLPARGPIGNTLQDIEGGIRSACSYVGARSIKDLPKCATFVQVGRQANMSLWEHRI
jgi:GMP reductase